MIDSRIFLRSSWERSALRKGVLWPAEPVLFSSGDNDDVGGSVAVSSLHTTRLRPGVEDMWSSELLWEWDGPGS